MFKVVRRFAIKHACDGQTDEIAVAYTLRLAQRHAVKTAPQCRLRH